MTVTDLRAVQAEVRKGRWRENSQAKDWVGIAVAKVLKLDPKDKTAKAKIQIPDEDLDRKGNVRRGDGPRRK